MGRIVIMASTEEEFNHWYNTCYIPGFQKVPGVAARDSNPWSRRVRAAMRLDEGSPAVFERIFPKL